MAGSIGEALLRMMGQQDPRTQAAAALLGAGGTGTPGTPAPAAPGGGAPVAPGQPAAPAPATPTAYNSPPDLLSMYSALTDQQRKVDGINKGIDLIAAGFAAPENRGNSIQMANGEGSGTKDPLALVQAIQKQQLDTSNRATQLQALPEIAQKYGLSIGTAKELWSTGKLDDYILQQTKPDRTTMADGSGQLQTIDQSTGAPVGAPIGPPKVETQVITDDSTGKQRLVNSKTGTTVSDLGGGVAPTPDEKNLDTINKQRIAEGEKPYNLSDWIIMKSKSGATNVNVGDGASSKTLLAGLDTDLIHRGNTADTAGQAVNSIQNAWQSLNAPGGIIAGSKAAVPEMEARKMLASIFGYDDDGVTNTESYLANIKNNVLANTKKLGSGSGFSDTDRQYFNQMAGGDQDMPVASMKQILRIGELANRNNIIDYNKRVADRLSASAGADGTPDPTLAKVLKPKPVPPLSDSVMNMVDPEDLKSIAGIINLGKEPPAKFIHQFENGDPSKNIMGYGIGSYQAVADRIKGEQ